MSSPAGNTMMTVRCRGTWEEATRTSMKVRRFDPFISDEPEALGGTDKGPNPMEYMMAAWAGCISVMLHVVAGEMNFKYEGVDLVADGDLDIRGLGGDPNVQPHFQALRLKVRIKTSEPRERAEQLLEQAEKRCPAASLFRAAKVPTETKLEIV